jgi:hypothetical protein
MKKLLTIMLALTLILTGFTISPATLKAEAKSLKVSCKTNTIKNKKLTMKKGKTAQLTVKFGKTNVTKKAKYKSSKPSVVKVNKTGKLQTLKKGAVTIKTTYKKKTVSIKVTVKEITKKPANCSHDWDNGKVTRKATCIQTGIKTYTCWNCGKTKTESIPKTDHKITVTKKDSTCTSEGWEKKSCSVCGKVFSEVKYQKVPHDWYDCRFCSNINRDDHTYKVHAKNLYYPKDCPRHYWEYDNCFYCNTPNPQPGILKGWESNYRNQTCRKTNDPYDKVSGHRWNGNHYCNTCSIEEPYWVSDFCGTCCGDIENHNGTTAKQLGITSIKDATWTTLDMSYWNKSAHAHSHFQLNHSIYAASGQGNYASMRHGNIEYAPCIRSSK